MYYSFHINILIEISAVGLIKINIKMWIDLIKILILLLTWLLIHKMVKPEAQGIDNSC